MFFWRAKEEIQGLSLENKALKKELKTLKESAHQEKRRKFLLSPPLPNESKSVVGTVYFIILCFLMIHINK